MMATQKPETGAMILAVAAAKEKPKPAPTLYAIIGFKLLKGLVFVGLALVMYCLSDNDLPAEYQDALHWLRVNPERKFWTDLAVRVSNLSEAEVLRAAIGSLIYSLFSLVEGVGLIFRVSWAGWLAIGESAFFIPIEILDLVHGSTRPVLVTSILILNILMLWVFCFRIASACSVIIQRQIRPPCPLHPKPLKKR